MSSATSTQISHTFHPVQYLFYVVVPDFFAVCQAISALSEIFFVVSGLCVAYKVFRIREKTLLNDFSL